MSRFFILALLLCVGCNPFRPASPALSLEQMWWSKGGSYRARHDKDDYGQPAQRMYDVVSGLSPRRFNSEFDQLLRTPRKSPSTMPDETFDDLLLASIPTILAERHDEKRMTAFLADHCSDSQYELVEFKVASSFKNSVCILGDSYSQSKTAEGRRCLVRVFRRAFPALTSGVANEKVVKNCVNWYRPRKDALVVNLEYPSNYGISNISTNSNQNPVGLDDEPSPTGPPLFIFRSNETPENAEGRKSLDIR